MPDGPTAEPPAKARKTHSDEATITILKSLPLIARIRLNKEIETKNISEAVEAIGLKSVKREEAALAEEERRAFENEKMEWEERQSKRRRGVDSDDEDSSGEGVNRTRGGALGKRLKDMLKLRKEDEREDELEQITLAEIPEIVKITKVFQAFPHNWCEPNNFNFLMKHAYALPSKTVLHPSTNQSYKIINIVKVQLGTSMLEAERVHWVKLRSNQPPTFGDFISMFPIMIELQKARNPEGNDFNSQKYHQHFDFFISCQGQSNPDFYHFWSTKELEMHKCFRNQRTGFDRIKYKLKWRFIKSEWESEKKWRISCPTHTQDMPAGSSRMTSLGGTAQLSRRPEKKKRHLEDEYCVLCSRKGHSAMRHKSFHGSSFLGDRQPYFLHQVSQDVFGTDNPTKPVCILWNLSRNDTKCAHTTADRHHVCSFCGSGGHHALAWSCHTAPA
ncbi:hypothetical protein FA15DRAFT_708749 [Coprinopsis marcescibilis]|uniref:Uncharacterized protein n=1 Tax=Coprinopsis marcescibilis TaxID=230819 RepID=A0A5C3KUW7_COPMA|nr:hypothetical protein FA15DRAFT_708749 [Coprinopsis marcescibilis]